jgi:steroid delta-isomerase-like uncharacterized protein
MRITCNLAPAEIRKIGSGFDLPIAACLCRGYSAQKQWRIPMQENIAVIRKVFQAINQRNLDAIPPLLAPGFIRHDLTGLFDEIKEGEGIVQDFLQVMIKGFPDMQFQEDDIIATDSRLSMRYTIFGTHDGDFFGVPPTGKKVTINAVIINDFKDGKISEAWQLIDFGGLFRQIGKLKI